MNAESMPLKHEHQQYADHLAVAADAAAPCRTTKTTIVTRALVVVCGVAAVVAGVTYLSTGLYHRYPSSSSVALINSNNNGADTEDTDVTKTMRDNYVYFDNGGGIVKAKFLYGPTKGYMVSEGEPYGGVGNTHDGKLSVRAGRHGTLAVGYAFNHLEGELFKFDEASCRSHQSGPAEMNFYVISDVQLEGYGTLQQVALAQDKNSNGWWMKSRNCFLDDHYACDPYICNLTNGKQVVFQGENNDHATIYLR